MRTTEMSPQVPPSDKPAAGNTALPSPDSVQYRKALSCFATGVTVVGAHWQAQDWAMTCNSFASVSLDPRLVLWSIRRQASNLDAFIRSNGFSVSVLADSQAHWARQFASGSMAERFADVPVERQDSGRLRLCGALAWFDCDLHQVIEAGDHYILLGAVRDFGWTEGNALGFCRSQFGLFEALVV
jgi:3-hydroxy-9,10-secoandrosta-1,3,5(10)-triene-9,17-dione monooxygenase reductase component